jgi:ABC-type Fe3+-siderophore transport system permease subunit
MKRYTPGQLITSLLALMAVTALLILGRPWGPWLVLGAFVLGSFMLIPAFALAFLLRAIGRSPERHVLLPEQTPDLPRRHHPAVGWIAGDIR